jgi:molybdopterin-guanine dinucleotide biosynthesis protein A
VPKIITIRQDVRPERGSLVGIHSALATAGDDVLVVAWDMPFVSTALLSLIASRLVPGVFAAIPETARGLQPLCAAYSRRCLPLIERAIDAGNLKVSAFVDALPVVRLIGPSELEPLGDPERLFFNVNTPADLAEAERMARGD